MQRLTQFEKEMLTPIIRSWTMKLHYSGVKVTFTNALQFIRDNGLDFTSKGLNDTRFAAMMVKVSKGEDGWIVPTPEEIEDNDDY